MPLDVANHQPVELLSAAKDRHAPIGPPPSIQRLRLITQLKNVPMNVGETWYIVSHIWYKQFVKSCRGEIDKDGALDQKSLMAIDNSNLIQYDGHLGDLLEGVTVDYVPEQAWKYLNEW